MFFDSSSIGGAIAALLWFCLNIPWWTTMNTYHEMADGIKTASDRTPYGSPPCCQQCGVRSLPRVDRVRASRENDLAATVKAELTATFVFAYATGAVFFTAHRDASDAAHY